jgi:hypothetical protein
VEHEHPQQNQGTRRDIGDLDCLSICVLLAHGMDSRRLLELLEPMVGHCCRHRLGHPAHLLQMAHSACHRQGVFAQMVSEELDLAHADVVSRVAGMEADELLAELTPGSETVTVREQAGLAWALLRSDDARKRSIGGFVIHAIFQGLGGRGEPAGHGEMRRIHLEHQCEGLRQALEQKQQEIDDMLAYIHRTRSVEGALAVGQGP